ncbi:MAG: cytochrome C oxidase subunit IV family protein [Bacteroidia bacterium]|nr:cytochrome C oxidase subunit IV family protein [Bacteroidia bacterium]
MEFNDNYPKYEVMSNHDEEYGKKARRKLWNVFWLMLFVTIAELVVGFIAPSKGWTGTFGLKFFFISFTLIKAGAIVWWFMHLEHEVKFFKYVILLPYSVFMLYAIFIILTEGTYAGGSGRFAPLDPIFKKQQAELKLRHGHGASHGSHNNAGHEGETGHH